MERQVTCCFTGHRPGKLPWGYQEEDPRCMALKGRLRQLAEDAYNRGFRHFLSGMALGSDQFFAEAILSLGERRPGVTLEAVIPFPGQDERWPEQDRIRYRAILERCTARTVVQPWYSWDCMFRRNRYMVDNSALLLAVYNGEDGGTLQTITYAREQGLEVLWIPPEV